MCMQITGILQPPWYIEYASKTMTAQAIYDTLVF